MAQLLARSMFHPILPFFVYPLDNLHFFLNCHKWRYHDKKRISFVIKKGNADVFYEQIKLLNDCLLKEWIQPGNKIENFKKCSAKIVIVLDNASCHKRKDILEKIEAEMPNIILEFLPPYSPDYNLQHFPML